MRAQDVINDLLQGRASVTPELEIKLSARDGASLQDKFRQAYFWIVNNAVISPYYDVQFGDPKKIPFSTESLDLPQTYSYSSYILLPLLTLMARKRALMIGAPGRGKTSIAILMGILSGYTKDELQRSVQHGHPQLTVSDLLGAPLPSDLVKAETAEDIKVSWRKWLTMRVKIVDEYNRIPTKTQSALLSLLAEGYAEMFDQSVSVGDSAWFLTANDDQGGGTFAVIEALKDRIDVVVRCTAFNSRYLETLISRIESGRAPEDFVPKDIVFSEAELHTAAAQIRALPMPADVRDRLGFFLGQLDFCRQASDHFEYKNKDTLHLGGKKLAAVCNEQCPLDKNVHLCTQTENGVSVRAFLTAINFAKAMAYFRGAAAVAVDDLRQILPWVLHEKLVPNKQSAFFDREERQRLLVDRVGWIRQMFDAAMTQFSAHEPVRAKVTALKNALDKGLEGVSVDAAQKLQRGIVQLIEELGKKSELGGAIYEDVVHLKAMYSRVQNYVNWLGR
ncbi:MAG: AAA family ATPase [Deltaproteobacteria bacterium]|nr:AAA family ATPase [Deltaproteobacteria bacterium]